MKHTCRTSIYIAVLALSYAACSDDDVFTGRRDLGFTIDQQLADTSSGRKDINGGKKDTSTPDQSVDANDQDGSIDLAPGFDSCCAIDATKPDVSPDIEVQPCGSCHALPPNSGRHEKHKEKGITCWQCHGYVVDSDNKVINPSLHNNGQNNYSGNATFNGTTCVNGCHRNDRERW